jgi:hypothetical protein
MNPFDQFDSDNPFNKFDTPPPSKAAGDAPSRIEKLAMGARDMVVGPGQAAIRVVPQSLRNYLDVDKSGILQLAQGDKFGNSGLTPERVDQAIQGAEKDYQARRGDSGMDWWRLGGNIGAAAPLSVVAPSTGTTLVSTGIRGALTGGLTNMLNPATDETKSFGEQKREQGPIGAVTGGVFAPAMQAGGRVVAPQVSELVKSLRAKGVDLTPGQILGPGWARAEEALTSIPGVGDLIKSSQRRAMESFNVATYDEVLKPIGVKYAGKEAGNEGVKKVGDILSAEYDKLVPDLKLVPDGELYNALFAATDAKSRMSESAAKQFTAILEQDLPKGPLEGAALKQLESKLLLEIRRFGKSQDPSDQMISEALGEVHGAILDNLARVNPKHAEKLGAINAGWSNLVRLERAAANTKDGIFTPEGLLNAVKASDDSVRKRATARGTAGPMQDIGKEGNELLGRTVPDSGSPARIFTSGAALGYVEPNALIAAAMGSAPYTEMGQKLATAILLKRPGGAPKLRELIESGAVPGSALAPLGLGATVQPSPKRR